MTEDRKDHDPDVPLPLRRGGRRRHLVTEDPNANPPGTPDEPSDEQEVSRLEELVAARRKKAQALRERGIDPFPVIGLRPTHSLADVVATWGQLGPGEETGEEVVVAGRLVRTREHGRLAFGVLREGAADLQLFCQQDVLGEDGMAFFSELDPGDWVAAEGEVMVTRKGELSVSPTRLVLLAKALHPLPDPYYGLRDVERRYRQRELDLILSRDSRRVFEIRSSVVRALREELDRRGFAEVETPTLHPIPGGAAAQPFVTHHRALDVDLYLRIATELYLKRLIVGGFSRVYEIGRIFRNEGLSPRHNPEFTMLEAYQAYADLDDMVELTEALVVRAAEASVGTVELSYQGRDLSLAPPWPRRPLLDLVREATGTEIDYETPLEDLRRLCAAHEVPTEAAWGAGKLVVELYEKLVEPEIWEPVFVIEHPVETSPLARRHRSKEHVVERFEPLVAGRELGNAFTELTDPDDQRVRFEAQAAARDAGDVEAMRLDEAFLAALELGMPPTGGLGIGVDRLVMLLADAPSIRDVILFPT
ncbi:MAG: lysine--tRNA ligase, partial [Nitriliruptorales bacterium]